MYFAYGKNKFLLLSLKNEKSVSFRRTLFIAFVYLAFLVSFYFHSCELQFKSMLHTAMLI